MTLWSRNILFQVSFFFFLNLCPSSPLIRNREELSFIKKRYEMIDPRIKGSRNTVHLKIFLNDFNFFQNTANLPKEGGFFS